MFFVCERRYWSVHFINQKVNPQLLLQKIIIPTMHTFKVNGKTARYLDWKYYVKSFMYFMTIMPHHENRGAYIVLHINFAKRLGKFVHITCLMFRLFYIAVYVYFIYLDSNITNIPQRHRTFSSMQSYKTFVTHGKCSGKCMVL